MANLPISGFTNGAPAQAGDEFVIARALPTPSNFKLTTAQLATYMSTGLSSLTLGTQSTTQGTLILANTAVGAFPTTLQASNSASAAWTLTLPTTAGSNGFILTTNGSGVTSWTNPTALGVDLDVGTTAITNGTAGRLLFEGTGNVLQESANLTWDNTNQSLGITSVGSGTGITTSSPVLNLTQTWNGTNSTLFYGAKINISTTPNTTSDYSSPLFAVQINSNNAMVVGATSGVNGGFAFLDLRVNSSSPLYSSATIADNGTTTGIGNGRTNLSLAPTSLIYLGGGATSFRLAATTSFGWSTSPPDTASDLQLTRAAAATLQLGAADAAGSAIAINSVASNQLTLASNHGLSNGAAVIITGTAAPSGTTLNTLYYARSISAAVIELYDTYQNAITTSGTTGRVSVTTAGTSASVRLSTPFQTFQPQSFTGTDIPGQPFIIKGSRGTGTGAGGSIIFQVAPAGSTGTAQNAYSTALTIDSTKLATFGGSMSIPSGAFFGTPNFIAGSGGGSGLYFAAGDFRIYTNGVNSQFRFTDSPSRFMLGSATVLAWGSVVDTGTATADTILVRDGAPDTLALRNGTSAQTFRVYNTYNGTNDEWGTFDFSSVANNLTIGTLKSGSGVSRSIRLVVGGTRVAVSDGSFFQVDVDLYPTQNVIMAAKYTEMSEMTAPTAPAANKVRIYAEDNGSGKTRLMALFNTGAAQQIAIEP